MFWVYVGLLILALIYSLSRNRGGTPKFDIQRAVHEQQQEDARKNLEDAQDAYRRSLQPTTPPRD